METNQQAIVTVPQQNQQQISNETYNYCYRGCLWKYYLAVAIYYFFSAMLKFALGEMGGGDFINAIIYALMAFAFKDLSFTDKMQSLFINWGPLELCHYFTCGCYDCQKTNLYYNDIQDYSIEDYNCFRHYYGISRCCFDSCTTITYSNAGCFFCDTKRYKVFKFRLRNDYQTWYPFKEFDPLCCFCCRIKYIGLVTDDVQNIQNLLSSKSIAINNNSQMYAYNHNEGTELVVKQSSVNNNNTSQIKGEYLQVQ